MDESYFVELEKEIENIKWEIIGISEMRRLGEKIIEFRSKYIFISNIGCFLFILDCVVLVIICILR